MPRFRFEMTLSGQTTACEEELHSVDLASPTAIEKAHAALEAGADQCGSEIKVYDEAGSLVATVIFSRLLTQRPTHTPGDSREP